MSTTRPTKHARPASTVSRSPKRVKEGGEETAQSETDWDMIKMKERKRGKKRDNIEVEEGTEAESTYDDVSDDGTVREHTARKPKDKKKKEAKSARIDNEDSPSTKLASSSKKKKKQRQEDLRQVGSSKGKGKRTIDDSEDREIGEEWTDLNGLKWKMGEDGQIRREAVIVEMRLKYPSMPKDSRHPDAKVQIPVHVERYLTEDEYKEARANKLLSHQEIERQREVEEAEEEVRKRQREEDEAKQKRALESGRLITTPKKVRNLQALFSTARKPSSPSQHSLPFTISRSQSLSSHSSHPDTPAPTSVKRLSLSMGRDDVEAPSPHPPPLIKAVPSKPTPPLPIPTSTPLRQKVSYRLPLASPTSPISSAINVTSRSSPVTDITAKRKRETKLLQLLQEEAERRKNRETIR
ncbi:hypothetical protein CBS101457_001063 [Exobasidium rhododendri]|nr:hypothetical protein CBS101457_001063 [Exobasidium rhododendri]